VGNCERILFREINTALQAKVSLVRVADRTNYFTWSV